MEKTSLDGQLWSTPFNLHSKLQELRQNEHHAELFIFFYYGMKWGGLDHKVWKEEVEEPSFSPMEIKEREKCSERENNHEMGQKEAETYN